MLLSEHFFIDLFSNVPEYEVENKKMTYLEQGNWMFLLGFGYLMIVVYAYFLFLTVTWLYEWSMYLHFKKEF